MSFKGHDGKHGGIASGSDRHCIMGAHTFGQRHQPVALYARTLRKGAMMGLPDAPAVQYDLVSLAPVRMVRRQDRARKVDAGNQWPAAHNRRLSGDGKPVLVIHRCRLEDRKSTRLNSSPRENLVCRLLLEKKK